MPNTPDFQLIFMLSQNLKNDVVAFVVGDSWCDLFLMKSTDGGETFEKTVIWQHPYPLWQFGTATDTFYCADGSQSLVIDNSGMVHVAFGITRALADAENTYWYPFVDGIAYWNENMPAFSNNVDALNPSGGTGSELIVDYNLIAWTQDVNQNGQLDFVGDIGFLFYWACQVCLNWLLTRPIICSSFIHR